MSTRTRTAAALSVLAAVLSGAAVATAAAPAATAATTAASPTCTMSTGSGVPMVATTGAQNGTIDVLDSLAQVLPTRHFAGASSVTACAARNYYASFQIEVSADHGSDIANLAMSASDLTGPGGATIPGTGSGAASDVQFSREDYVTLSRLSDGELDPQAGSLDTVTPAASRVARNESTGQCTGDCRFPDTLVPDRDAVYGEKRNAFAALTVPAGQNRAVWADIFVPATATAGIYTGSISVTQSTGRTTSVPVQLQVSTATLPATSSMHSAFFYENPGKDPVGYQAAAELGLDDRIAVVPDGIVGGANGPRTVLGPLLNGTDPRVKLQNADGTRAALTDLPMSAMWNSFSTYKPLFTASTVTQPWAYCDEWGSAYCAAQYAQNAASAWPGIPVLAIDAASPMSGYDTADAWADPQKQAAPAALSSSLGAMVDLQQFVQPAEGWLKALPQYNADTSDRASILTAWAAAKAGRQVWTYLSNMSGSSDYTPGVARYQGYSSYGIDQIASEQLSTGWQSFIEGFTGQLYWSVNQPISSSLNTAVTGLTGDGTLFYPYNTAQVGGTTPVPMESIRLKRIRNGEQDYELLKLATAQHRSLADGRTARSIATSLFPAMDASAVAPAAYDAAEQDVFRLFPAGTTGTQPPPAKINAHDLDCNGTPDFLAVQAGTGALLFYPRTQTDWAPNAPVTVGSGFGASAATATYASLLLPGDLNGDGSPDLLGRRSDGSLWLMAGNCTGRFGPAVQLPVTTTSPVAAGDFDGDGRPDLLDKHADGTLWLLAGNGSGGFAAARQVGAGWGALEITGVGDVNNDGAVDLIARQADGSVLLYEGNGAGGWKTVYAGVATGLTLPPANYPSLLGVGDLNGDGFADLVAIDSAGTMWRYDGTGLTAFGTTATRIGGGWTSAVLSEIAR